MKRFVLVEIDEDWGDNAVLDEFAALPCSTCFHGVLDAVELQEVAARIASDEAATGSYTVGAK